MTWRHGLEADDRGAALRNAASDLIPTRPQQDEPVGGSATPDAPATKKPKRDARTVLLAVLTALGGVLFLHEAKSFMIPVVLAILISYMLDPFVAALERYRVPRVIGATAMSLTLLVSLGFAAYSLSDNVMDIVNRIPQTAARLRQAMTSGRPNGDAVLDQVLRAASEITKTAEAAQTPQIPRSVARVQVAEPLLSASDYLAWGNRTLGFVGSATSILFLAFFMLVSGDLYKRKIVKVAGPTLTAKRTAIEILEEIRVQVGRFLLVQLLIGSMVAVSTWTVLYWLGIEQAIFWSLAAGIFSTVPYFGPMLVAVGLAFVTLAQLGSLSTAVYVGLASALIASIKGFLIAPWLAGRASRMNQVAILIGLVFWIWVWGIPGMLLALPIMASMKAVCERIPGLTPIGELLSE